MAAANLYPFNSSFLDLGGHRCHVIDEGQGEPVLMVHGNPTWSFYFRRLILALRGSYRAVAPDHIGCGLSDKPDDAHYHYTLTQRVADLEAVVEELELGEAITLVLHDWGGMIGMAFAARHPSRIARLILLNTAAFHLPSGKRLPWQLRLARSPLLGALLVRGLNAFVAGAVRTAVRRGPLDAEIRAAYRAPYDSWRNRIAVHRFVQDIPLAPRDESYELVSQVAERLPSFTGIPSLICWGMQDFVFDESFLQTWRRYLPHAEVHRFVDAGHWVLEDAADEILLLVTRFLRANPLTEAG